ncbi:MAG: hypothetical protein KKA81_09110 [Bacteroidetes bacterium]|nr:hypothetical protein [Bacteroidota bacterium]
MKNHLLTLLFLLACFPLMSQWIQVNNGLGNFPPTSMYVFVDTVYVGTFGGGIYRTLDEGNLWTAINGDLANLNVNDIRPGPIPKNIFVATSTGPYFTQDLLNYQNCTSTGLTNTDIHYFWFGGDDATDWAVGTNGGGVFASPDYYGPWTAYNTGISGEGLKVNDIGGYSDNSIDYSVMATDGGMYYSMDNLVSWTEKNNGLSGDALLVQKLTGLGSMVIIATRDGLFMSYDGGDTWTEQIADEKLNTVFITQSALSSTGFYCFAFGENGFFSEDFINYSQVDLSGLSGGEITCAAVNSSHMFLGTTLSDRSGGGVFRKPLDLVVGMPDEKENIKNFGQLNQNQPNPVTTSTTITYVLNNPGRVNLRIFSALGQEVQSLVNAHQGKGLHQVTFAPEGYGGICFYSLEIDGVVVGSRRMAVVK